MDAVKEQFDGLDILFVNAGVGRLTPLGSTTAAAFADIMNINVTGAFLTIQAAAPLLGAGSTIILSGSNSSTVGSPGYAAYSASKAAIRSMTRVLASEFAPRGIRVNVVVAGATHTPIWAPFMPTPEAAAQLESRMVSKIPLRRVGEPEEIAQVVLFLASSMSSNMTAAEVVADGGASDAPFGAPGASANAQPVQN
jgi:NAD(P)-dependent dehydrogenase (short-subunit alcohol dehydrogenase family)